MRYSACILFLLFWMLALLAASDLLMMSLNNSGSMVMPAIWNYVTLGRRRFFMAGFNEPFNPLDALWLLWCAWVFWFSTVFLSHCSVSSLLIQRLLKIMYLVIFKFVRLGMFKISPFTKLYPWYSDLYSNMWQKRFALLGFKSHNVSVSGDIALLYTLRLFVVE